MATLIKVGGISLESDNELTDAINTDELLSLVQDRVLWIAMQLVHHANNVRSNPDGTKVGGHQASSSSIVTIMTSLFYDFSHLYTSPSPRDVEECRFASFS